MKQFTPLVLLVMICGVATDEADYLKISCDTETPEEKLGVFFVVGGQTLTMDCGKKYLNADVERDGTLKQERLALRTVEPSVTFAGLDDVCAATE
ncbi:hypothetical protein BaRGS_00019585, partial [Batillaria attramentaria]